VSTGVTVPSRPTQLNPPPGASLPDRLACRMLRRRTEGIIHPIDLHLPQYRPRRTRDLAGRRIHRGHEQVPALVPEDQEPGRDVTREDAIADLGDRTRPKIDESDLTGSYRSPQSVVRPRRLPGRITG
jgi:hypothetical protein